MSRLGRRGLIAGLAATPFAAAAADDWASVLEAAAGRTVFFNAWGGDEKTNAFIAWAADILRREHRIDLRHVRLRDTSEAVARVVAEKAAGRLEGGSVDLIWLNGPNFLAMKEQGLLFGPMVDRLPNARYIDRAGKPSTMIDFTVPVDGLEVPWRMAQVVFLYDTAQVARPPRSMAAMLDWARGRKGRLTHPTVRNFLGATFLKQALYELCPNPAALQRPASNAAFRPAADALWAWYDQLRPLLWRGGREFPANGPAQRPLLLDGEIDIAISFNPAEASLAIQSGELPDTVRTFVLERGTIGNTSFVAIPFNAANVPGAMVVADFLLSPQAQAEAQDPRVLGAATVLDLASLPESERARFEAKAPGVATLSAEALGVALLEPHASWMTRVTAEWDARYRG